MAAGGTRIGSVLAGEPAPGLVVRGHGRSRFLLVCEHASKRLPKSLGTLGLTAAEQDSHIAWDLGAEALARDLSRRLDAPLLVQLYSRLAFDCNRPPGSETAILEASDGIEVPGNRNLSAADRRARIDAIYQPFRAALADLIDARTAAGPAPVLVTVHSFTRLFQGARRAVDVGIIHDADARLATRLAGHAARWGDIRAARNEPYGPADGVTHTLREHALPRGLMNVMLEVANDLIADDTARASMAERLGGALRGALAGMAESVGPEHAATGGGA